MNELKRRERWAELAASIAQADANAERRPHSWWRFWLIPYHELHMPIVAEPAPEAPAFVSGAGPGAVGSGDDSQPPVTTQGPGGARRLAGLAGPQPRRCPPGDETGPATPHLPPPLCSRISAGITWT